MAPYFSDGKPSKRMMEVDLVDRGGKDDVIIKVNNRVIDKSKNSTVESTYCSC